MYAGSCSIWPAHHTQIRSALRASGASPHEEQCFARALRLRLRQIREVAAFDARAAACGWNRDPVAGTWSRRTGRPLGRCASAEAAVHISKRGMGGTGPKVCVRDAAGIEWRVKGGRDVIPRPSLRDSSLLSDITQRRRFFSERADRGRPRLETRFGFHQARRNLHMGELSSESNPEAKFVGAWSGSTHHPSHARIEGLEGAGDAVLELGQQRQPRRIEGKQHQHSSDWRWQTRLLRK